MKKGLQTAKALWYVSPQRLDVQPADVPFVTADEVIVRTHFSAVSRGTERLVFRGEIPPAEFERMRAPFQKGDFPFPVSYGYACAGVIDEGPATLLGRRVFCLHPHQDMFAVSKSAVVELPPDVPLRRAVLAANMETALNALWDAGAGPGQRIAIVGAGALGLLIASLCAALPGAEVKVADVNHARQAPSEALGAVFVETAALSGFDADIVFHTSASAGGLAASLDAAGLEAAIVELSWYGCTAVSMPLGGAFHSQRLRLISSQVGHVSAAQRARWTTRRRLEKAVSLLRNPALDCLITSEIQFEDAPRQLPRIFEAGSNDIVAVLRYSAADQGHRGDKRD